ncbi:uncharacterized protein si:ch73-109d9.1 isoform X2 [Anguilla anguilla]|nr:uncharacterized protein si:ch73-109d9.1 isoform X1 [Anguilla anguilla]XP_035274800.1 uncharacterized protein si:ch73-109d9.1 isoform X1 [Anguilla anguilla]XP_035274801.1 uncharacterized protein si:ch73-109d9.1 isoform X1 [Anguilla anguilla]XP_035274802.1 uncharacterized protein si:ch73-109d9.1 isoform X2 [Anguilla anguilla]
MSDAILTFQVQLSTVMETVLKSAMYEITRLVEDSFLEEVARSKQEVEALRQRLQWSESRRRERESGGRARCLDCGRVGVSSEESEDPPSETLSGAEADPPPPLSKGCAEPEWSPAVGQDTAPSSGSLLPERQSSRPRGGEACGAYESEAGQEAAARRLGLAGPQRCGPRRSDPDSQRVTWTTFKLGDSHAEAEGLDPPYAAAAEPASPQAHRDPQPRPAEEGAGNSASPLQYLNVKSEALLIKEEAEVQPVCSEELRWDVAHRESWDRGDLQVEHTAHSPPPQGAVTSLQCFPEKLESLALRFPPQQQGAAKTSSEVDLRQTRAQVHQLTATNLRAKRGKTKSTDGQREFSNVARQVLTQFQVWQNACYSKNIDWNPVTAKIISALPQLRGRETEVVDRCTKMLQNRREYLRRTGQVTPPKYLISGAPPPETVPNHMLRPPEPFSATGVRDDCSTTRNAQAGLPKAPPIHLQEAPPTCPPMN